MAELPVPDLRDSGGRLRRLVLALIVGGAAAALGYYIADSLARPTELHHGVVRAYQFVFYIAGLAGAIAFSITLAVSNHLAKQKYLAGRVPVAKQVR